MMGRFRINDTVFSGRVSGEHVKGPSGTYDLNELEILPPTIPSKVVCVGLNYLDHARELDMPLPDHPMLFLKPPSAVIGHGSDIQYPAMSRQVDYEAELAVVIGTRCKHVRARDAGKVILGYTCFNDVTARDIQQQDVQWTRAKSFDTFAPMGPFIVEPDSIDLGNTAVRSRVNGHIRQDSNTHNMIFDVPHLIEFISQVMTLEPGDVIATGTPVGVGELHIGDVVEVEIQGVGTLINRVVG